MTDRPRRSKRTSVDPPNHLQMRIPGPVALPEVKLDYGGGDEDADAGGQTSEFVKRLHNMLEQNVYPGIIEWTQGGDAFVVKDMGAFISTVTPRQFKHSNFASFVRQLNKYDFHKIKASDADAMDEGKQAWVFRHPHFRAGGVAKLDLIKRKTPAQRKPSAPSDNMHGLGGQHDMAAGGDDVREELDALRSAYQSVSSEMAGMQRTMRSQRQLIATLYARLGEPMPSDPQSPDLLPKTTLAPLGVLSNAPLSAAQTPLARATTRPTIDLGTLTVPSLSNNSSQRDWESPPSATAYGSGMQWTRTDADANLAAETSAAAQQRQQEQQQQAQVQQELSQKTSALLSVPNTNSQQSSAAAYTPMWSTKPRVLLVDDDAVSRTISSKFLSVLGCSFDIAQDGVAALEHMDRAQYDLVLMDIVMPRLDGLAATTRIRQFDARTPIISMTGNSHPADVVRYMNSGMNDVLCKPFTRDGLVAVLEKHLIHLRAVWDLRSIPRSPGLPPMSDAHFHEALAAGPLVSPGVNLLASNGVADDEFASLLQGFTAPAANGGGSAFGVGGMPMLPPMSAAGLGVGVGKRSWDSIERTDSPFGNDSKRPRFELVE